MENILINFREFFVWLQNQNELIDKIKFEENKNFFVIKTVLSKKFENQRVEIILKITFYGLKSRNEYFVMNFIKIYPPLKPLYLIFRRLLHSFSLDNPLEGGINTFSIFLMIVGFLQKTEGSPNKRVSETSINPDLFNTSFKSSLSNSTKAREKCETSVNFSIQNQASSTSVGELFVNLLNFYSYSFDYKNCFLKPYVVESPNSECVFKVHLKEARI